MGPSVRPVLGGCLLALLAAAPACGDVNANDQPFAGMVVYKDPS